MPAAGLLGPYLVPSVAKMELSLSILFLLLLLSYEAQGADLSLFVEKYKTAIDKYVMAGYGAGWDHCDVVTDYAGVEVLDPVPQLVIELEKLLPPENPTSSSGNIFT